MRQARVGSVSYSSIKSLFNATLRLARPCTIRHYSTQNVPHAGNQVKTQIRHGISQPIDVLITYPPRPENDSPVILSFGNGTQQAQRDNDAQTLSWSANATIVSPLYNISRKYSFPAPVHMSLRVFDWMSHNLSRIEPDAEIRKFGVCGGGVCGELATMLALTECKPDQPGISAAAVNNPILDWTDLFPEGRHMVDEDLQCSDLEALVLPEQSDDARDWDVSVDGLLALRRELFRKAEDFFDPFASPLLLFRTAHFDLPYSFYRHANIDSSGDDNSGQIVRKRTYHRAYPPLRSGLVLPKLRMTAGKDYVLKHQAAELEHFMRRSIMRDKEQSHSVRAEDVSSRIATEERDGRGIWDQRHVVEIGQWLGETLRQK